MCSLCNMMNAGKERAEETWGAVFWLYEILGSAKSVYISSACPKEFLNAVRILHPALASVPYWMPQISISHDIHTGYTGPKFHPGSAGHPSSWQPSLSWSLDLRCPSLTSPQLAVSNIYSSVGQLYMYIYVYMYICIYIYIYTHLFLQTLRSRTAQLLRLSIRTLRKRSIWWRSLEDLRQARLGGETWWNKLKHGETHPHSVGHALLWLVTNDGSELSKTASIT